MCSPCGPMVCYKYEDCGPALNSYSKQFQKFDYLTSCSPATPSNFDASCTESIQCLPRSAFKRNGLQDCQFFQQGSIRYLCRADCGCPKPCPPPCPPCVRRPPPGKTYKGSKKPTEGSRAEEGGAEKIDEKENQLKRTKSRELRGGIMYYSCHCIKRNGLQHDCRRTGCGGEPACLVLPDPVCAPSQLARARGLADQAPFAAHMGSESGVGTSGTSDAGTTKGKRFIVCELKGIVPDTYSGGNQSINKCCKCSPKYVVPSPTPGSNHYSSPQACIYTSCVAVPTPNVNVLGSSKCPCKCSTGLSSIFAFDEDTMKQIMGKFERKEFPSSDTNKYSGRGAAKLVTKEEPCIRSGCIHWQPPPPCVWNAPCKADCFETPPGIQPGRNPLMGGGGAFISSKVASQRNVSHNMQQPREGIKLLTPEFYSGCCSAGGQCSVSSGGTAAAGLPMMVMKLC